MPRHHDNTALHELLKSLQNQASNLDAENRARIARVHSASLPRLAAPSRQAAPDKQKSPEAPTSEDFTDRTPGLRSNGGRYAECA